MFNYGSFKLLLLKIFLGILLFCFSLFLLISIYTYNPNDPGIGRFVGSSEITNFFGFWGAVFSSIFLRYDDSLLYRNLERRKLEYKYCLSSDVNLFHRLIFHISQPIRFFIWYFKKLVNKNL